LILTRKEKEKLVIELAEKGNTTREIAKAVRISLGDIGKILKKYNGEDGLDEKLSIPSKAFLMFERGQKPLYVAIHLNLDEDATMNLYRSYLQLSRLDNYNQLLDDLGPDLQLFVHLYQTLKYNGLLFREFIKDFINQHNTLNELRSEVRELNDFLVKLEEKRLALESEIEYKSKKYHQLLERTGEGSRYLTGHAETEFDFFMDLWRD
jgi:transposase